MARVGVSAREERLGVAAGKMQRWREEQRRWGGVKLLEPGQAQLGLMVAMGAAERETPSWWLARLAGEGEDMAPA